MLKDKGFETLIASDPDHERLVCEIYFEGLFVALVSQERAEGLYDLETPGPGVVEEKVTRRVDLIGFQDALYKAYQQLKGERFRRETTHHNR